MGHKPSPYPIPKKYMQVQTIGRENPFADEILVSLWSDWSNRDAGICIHKNSGPRGATSCCVDTLGWRDQLQGTWE